MTERGHSIPQYVTALKWLLLTPLYKRGKSCREILCLIQSDTEMEEKPGLHWYRLDSSFPKPHTSGCLGYSPGTIIKIIFCSLKSLESTLSRHLPTTLCLPGDSSGFCHGNKFSQRPCLGLYPRSIEETMDYPK